MNKKVSGDLLLSAIVFQIQIPEDEGEVAFSKKYKCEPKIIFIVYSFI